MDNLAYKPNWRDVIERLRLLYAGQAADRIFATMEVPSPALAEFQAAHPEPYCDYPDPAVRADFWDRYLGERAVLHDDSLPSAYLSEFDQGLYGGLLGGDVRFMVHREIGWISSMVPALLRDWSEFEFCSAAFRRFLEAQPAKAGTTKPWWDRYLRQLKIFLERSRDKWGISHFILIDGLNFVFELLGATATYMSLDEQPEMVRRAIDLGFEVNLEVQRTFFDTVGLFHGGTFSNFGQWLPGRIVSESIDPFHMTSVAYFEQWGREPAERILAAFDGGVIHVHGNGRHLLSAAATLRGLRAILLLDDVGFPKAFDVLADLKARTGNVPLACFAEYEPFVERLRRHDLPGGVIYQVRHVPDADTANRLMDEVRAYRV